MWRQDSELWILSLIFFQFLPTYLRGHLAKVVDDPDEGVLLERVVDAVDVDVAFVEEIVEDVVCLLRFPALLLVAEDQVDPLVQVGAHVVTLQSLEGSGNVTYLYLKFLRNLLAC